LTQNTILMDITYSSLSVFFCTQLQIKNVPVLSSFLLTSRHKTHPGNNPKLISLISKRLKSDQQQQWEKTARRKNLKCSHFGSWMETALIVFFNFRWSKLNFHRMQFKKMIALYPIVLKYDVKKSFDFFSKVFISNNSLWCGLGPPPHLVLLKDLIQYKRVLCDFALMKQLKNIFKIIHCKGSEWTIIAYNGPNELMKRKQDKSIYFKS